MRFVVFNTPGQHWFWELRSHDDAPFARSAQGFSDRAGAIASVRAVQAAAGEAPTCDEIGGIAGGCSLGDGSIRAH